MFKVFVGTDDRFGAAYQVCVRSLCERSRAAVDVQPLMFEHLRGLGLYTRPTARVDGYLWDAISGAAMSTKFAIARFFVPRLQDQGWALFCDSDFLFRAPVDDLFALADPKYAVMVVKHDHRPEETSKMDSQPQQAYPRKNWSSLILWNCEHVRNRMLHERLLNQRPGRDLHAFCWLDDELIGELPAAWNWLDGISPPVDDVKAVHYTRGTPDLDGYANAAFAGEWYATLRRVEVGAAV
jgi:hypothetical protein